MNTYTTYQPTNITWLGDIPSHWAIKKLKHIFYEKPHTQNMSINSGSISFGEVVYKDDEKILEITKRSYQEVLSGEFLINPLNLNYDLISLRIALSQINVVVSAGYIVIKNKLDINKKYYKYLLHIYDVMYMKLLGSGVRSTISFNNITNSLLPIPPLTEQTAIADYLDKKTTQIQTAIRLKSEQIATLKEYRQALINQTLTQGLNPNAPMKNSGIEWLGDVPEHWEVLALKRVARIKNGLDYKQFEALDGYPVFGSGGQFAHSSKYLYDGEAILLGRKGTIDKPLYVNQKFWTVDTMFYCICNKNVLTKFIYYQCLTIPFAYYSTATALPSMTQFDLLNHKIGLPPLPEQTAIADYLDKKTAQIDTALATYQAQIDKLNEYQRSLVNDVVTGKIDVRTI